VVVVHVARHGEDHPLRGVAPDVERVQLRAGHVRDRLDAADDGPTHRVLAEHRRQEDVTQGVLGVVVAHGDLLEHDVALDLDVGDRTATPQDDVGDQVDREFDVGVEHMRVVAGVLARGERVQLTANGVDSLRDLDGRPRRRRLEQQVFEEVGGAGHAGSLIA
jgi:hypothetical protein